MFTHAMCLELVKLEDTNRILGRRYTENKNIRFDFRLVGTNIIISDTRSV